MDIQVLITTSTTDSTGPFTIVGNPGNVTIATGQTKSELVAGKTFSVSELISEITITDTGVCNQAITRSVIGAGGTTPTPTPFPYTSNSITQYSSASRLDACTGGAQQTVFYAGNNIEMLMPGDYLYQDSAGTPVANGYYFKSSIPYGVFYVTGSNGLIQTISDCNGNTP